MTAEDSCDPRASIGVDGVDMSLPLFVYGALQPREIGHWKVEAVVDLDQSHVDSIRSGWHIRDGRPIPDLHDSRDIVGGWVLFFVDPEAGYGAVGAYEPRGQYRWDQVTTRGGVRANMLVGRSPSKGSMRPDSDHHTPIWWRSADDPLLMFGVKAVRAITEAAGEESVGTDRPGAWIAFLQTEAALLLAWSIIERYGALRFGAGNPEHMIRQVAEDEWAGMQFRRGLELARIKFPSLRERVYDSRNPDIRSLITDPVRYLRLIRNNLAHRGKASWHDEAAVRASLVAIVSALPPIFERHIPGWVDDDRTHAT